MYIKISYDMLNHLHLSILVHIIMESHHLKQFAIKLTVVLSLFLYKTTITLGRPTVKN